MNTNWQLTTDEIDVISRDWEKRFVGSLYDMYQNQDMVFPMIARAQVEKIKRILEAEHAADLASRKEGLANGSMADDN